MTTHAYNSDSDPESERDEDTPAGALALPPKLCSGREVFCTTRNVAYHPSLRNERPRIFDGFGLVLVWLCLVWFWFGCLATRGGRHSLPAPTRAGRLPWMEDHYYCGVARLCCHFCHHSQLPAKAPASRF